MLTRLNTIADDLGISQTLLATRNLRSYTQAEQLEIAEIDAAGREYLLCPAAAEAWRQLRRAAAQDAVELFIVSAYRSVERQAAIIRQKLAHGVPIEHILTLLAPPGYSEHHTGCAVDIATPGTPPAVQAFEHTAAFVWLQAQAQDFGFYLSFPPGNPEGYQYEPWHWCFHATPPSPLLTATR